MERILNFINFFFDLKTTTLPTMAVDVLAVACTVLR